jgi:hypothetical protein
MVHRDAMRLQVQAPLGVGPLTAPQVEGCAWRPFTRASSIRGVAYMHVCEACAQRPPRRADAALPAHTRTHHLELMML